MPDKGVIFTIVVVILPLPFSPPLWYTLHAMKVSDRARYGFRILLGMAQHEQDDSPRTANAITMSQEISAAFISRATPLAT